LNYNKQQTTNNIKNNTTTPTRDEGMKQDEEGKRG
jgi:hypothetical protein